MTTWTDRTEPSTFWQTRYAQYLLQETGDFLFQESGDNIVLEQAGIINTTWGERTKPSTTWSSITRT